jgi:hypothetical protein
VSFTVEQRALCACGCNRSVSPGKTYRKGHARRIRDRWIAEDRGYSTPCWIWLLARNKKGYGVARVGTRMISAHRAVFEELQGEVPSGLQLDHLCRTHECVNPEHLEPVTARENILRGVGLSAVNARKNHCIKGHEFTVENTYIDTLGKRNCRRCRIERKRRYRAEGRMA